MIRIATCAPMRDRPSWQSLMFVLVLFYAILPWEAKAMSEVQCEIRSQPLATGVDLVGVVWADHSVSGSYQFIVNKEGASGSSRVIQRGLLALEKNQPQVVGSITINAGSGDRYIVRLTVTADGDQTLCTADLDNFTA
ncbi:curli-like amyloid fiber formation chaperone CsgH [Pelagibacterium halotolerans]|uniref:curli-like amyloid fiber formation chaperone CsgH n=1 Tax=Pelagibacterium halotolerans TaxID=531813 RepID=UPI00384DED52